MFIGVRSGAHLCVRKHDEYTGLTLRVHSVVQMVRAGQWGIPRSISLAD